MRKLPSVLAATIAMLSCSQGAFAKFTIEEVVVTARKVEENLQTTPVAVSAFTGNELEEVRGAVDITDLSGSAPNLSLSGDAATGGNSSAPVIFIRGIGQTDFNITTEPAVGIYVDGIFVARGVGGLLDLNDLDRIEVLRGPQGTLFGRNSIGGALNVISKKPTDEFEGKVGLKVGEDSLVQLSGMVNVPINESLKARFSGITTSQNGFVDAPFHGDAFGGKESTTFRGALRWDASDSFVADVVFDYSTSEQSSAPFHPDTIVPTGGAPGAFNAGVTTADCTGVDVNTSADCYGNFWLQGKTTNNSQFFDENLNPISPENKMDIYGVGLTLEWDTEVGTFKSVTGYRDVEGDFWSDLDHTPHLIFQIHNKNYENQSFSQEFQLAGSTENAMVDYVVGAYYFEEEGLQNVFLQRSINCDSNPGCIFQETFRDIDNNSKAVFAQATTHITNELHLTTGVRWTRDEKHAEFTFVRDTFNTGINQGNVGDLVVEETDPLLTLGWDVNDSVYAYVTYSEGFRDGGFPARFTGAEVNVEPFDPEFVEAIEVGLKMDLADGNVRINLAGFQTNYSDFQVTASVVNGSGGDTSTDNLADITIRGLEGEIYWVVTENLRMDLSFGLLDAEIDKLAGDGLSSAGIIIDDSFSVPYTPEFSGNLGISHIMPLSNNGELLSRLDYRFMDEQHTRIENTDETLAEAYETVNLSFTYRHPGDQWEFVLGVKNLTNEEYFSTSTISGSLSNATQTNVNRPRTAYAAVRYVFGE